MFQAWTVIMLYHPRDWDWNQIGGKPLHYAFDPARASVGNLGERKKKKNQDSKEECGTQQEEADRRGLQDRECHKIPSLTTDSHHYTVDCDWRHQKQGRCSKEKNSLRGFWRWAQCYLLVSSWCWTLIHSFYLLPMRINTCAWWLYGMSFYIRVAFSFDE